MTRIFTTALLLMSSMGAWAQQTINVNVTGSGTVKVSVGGAELGSAANETKSFNAAPESSVTLELTPGNGSFWKRPTVQSTVLVGTRTPTVSQLVLTGGNGDHNSPTTFSFTMPGAEYSGVSVTVEFIDDNPGYSGYYYLQNKQNDNNGYYLIPAIGGYYYDNEDTPFLTTYQTGKDANSIWCVEKVNLDGDEQDYYRFRHVATGKYITFNDAVLDYSTTPGKAARLRLHLEQFDSPTDATLFMIQKNSSNGRWAVRSKAMYDDVNNYYWWDISNGNVNHYWNNLDKTKDDYFKGALGIWNDLGSPSYNWEPEAADPTCATPLITYNEVGKTFSISYPVSGESGVTIHYTTDGSEPTASSDTYSSPISETGVSMVRAIAVKTNYDNSAVAELYAPNHPFMLKTIDEANQSYYLTPPTDDADATRPNVTTSNVPTPRMQWQLKLAEQHNVVQYYYFVNKETGKYMYCSVNTNKGNALQMKELDADGTEPARYMYRLINNGTYYLIEPKPFAYLNPNSGNNCLRKQNATDHNNPIGLYNGNTELGQWQILDVPADPKSLSALPAEMISDASNSVYFEFRSATQDDAGNDYFVYPPASVAYATAAASGSNSEWYIVPATDADTWNTYYNIRNAQTGDYLYFDSETKYNNNDNKFLTSSGITSGSEDKYKFLILKTARTEASGSYHIVPKSMRNNNNQTNIALSRENKTSAKLRTSNSRDNNSACWYLDAVDFKCDVPAFNYASGKLSITCSTDNAVIYYALGSSEPSINETNRYTGTITLPEGTNAVTAIAVRNANASDKSEVAIFTIEEVTSGGQITNMSGFYILGEGFTPPDTPIGTAADPFRGTIDGQLNAFSIGHPLIGYAEGATIRNVILDNVTISGEGTTIDINGGNKTVTGAIANVATGATRIYNCGILATGSTVTTDDDGYTHIANNSSRVGGTDYVGGLVGLLDGEARVINCFSYADITGGDIVGGIVGYNNIATTSQNLKTMVMNCMFYGDITGGSDKAPIYNGKIITNRGDQSGVSNFNYFWGGASYVQPTGVNYNCALMAETRFLQRFEFFRHLLNANRSLAAWWATGSMDNRDQMMKWVMEPSQIGSTTPYPILKSPGRYHSVVNIDSYDAESRTSNTIGNTLGTLTVKIQMGSGGAQFGAPTDAEITTSSLTLNITDKDPNHFNFNYGKVQLPYYNDVGTNNYRKASDGTSRVVTGWKIVSITGGTTGNFTTGEDAPAYNFADRNCTNKDLYGTGGSNRIFNQGAYWDVPENVTEITIEPYWAKAAYVSDAYADVVYSKDMKKPYNVPNVGEGARYNNGNEYPINGEQQKVYTTISNALGNGALNPNTSHTPYDYCIVLVGNYHQYNGIDGSKPYTVMSIDLDNDNEPDYSFMLRFDSRTQFHPLRYDFLNLIGLGMAQKSNEGTGSYNFGIAQPIGWFETTNTSLFRVTQFEYDRSNRVAAPLILQGGVIEQWVSGQNNGANKQTTYFLIGGNVWFKEFHIGCHQDSNLPSKHVPVSVTGGDFNIFYLTGAYKANVTVYDDNAECYVNGGRFGMVAGTGMEGLGTSATKGNITWQIDNADITEFYGGGINAAVPAKGNINSTISNSRVGLFCGGPKFGDMTAEKTVTTTATNCTFDTFFGAGYGGNSYSRHAPGNQNNKMNIGWNSWISGEYKQEWNNGDMFKAVSTQFDYQFLPMSGNADNVARIFIDFVKFSLATCRNVTSNLTNCTVTGNFYGGGSLGKVDGPVNSTLTNCKVLGSVFGAGFSASIPTVQVDSIGFRTEPYYYENLGTYRTGVKGKTTTYNWQYRETVNNTATAIDKTNHILYTTEKLDHTNLGTVTGKATLILDGTTVSGNVYGGGDQSTVYNNDVPANAQTEVTIKGGSQITGSVFGGGNEGDVSGSTKVNIQD